MDESSRETEWWWIDYLEDEMDPALDQDLETLLEYSPEDRKVFEKFRLIKKWLKESDPVAHWPIEDRLNNMRHRVMQAIEAQEKKEAQLLAEVVDPKSLSV